MSKNQVAQHYNLKKDLGLEARETSKILNLRKFNNWIKSVIIGFASRDRGSGISVLDLGCGKGGDLEKWKLARIRYLCGIDVAENSIIDARKRFTERKAYKFVADFFARDCFSESLKDLISNRWFEITSLQFCFHYAFETKEKVTQALENISSQLNPSGLFIGTIPNSEWIYKQVAKRGNTFGNDIYQIRFNDTKDWLKYGHLYYFTLQDAVEECPEYMVHFASLESLAKEYGLILEFKASFKSFFEQYWQDPEFSLLLKKLALWDGHGLDEDGMPRLNLSAEEWEVVDAYLVFAFRKVSTTTATATNKAETTTDKSEGKKRTASDE